MRFLLETLLTKTNFTRKRIATLSLALFLFIQFSATDISAETNKIAYASGNAIYKMNANGSDVQQLTFTEYGQKDFSPVWSPDGTKIAFVRSISTQEEMPPPSGGGWGWVGGGDPIYYTVTSYRIYTMDYDGANLTLIGKSASFINDLTWSPDGTQLAYVRGADSTYMGVFQTCGGNSYIYIVDAVADGAASRLSETVNGVDPSWSPDGTKIFYAVNNSPENYGIYSIDLSDNSIQRWTYDGATPADPEISPDGSKIVYATGYAQEDCLVGNMSTMAPSKIYSYRGSLILYNIAQNNYLMLTSGASNPTWNPTGTVILYASGGLNSSGEGAVGQELTTITAAGQNQTQIQNGQPEETSGSWSQ